MAQTSSLPRAENDLSAPSLPRFRRATRWALLFLIPLAMGAAAHAPSGETPPEPLRHPGDDLNLVTGSNGVLNAASDENWDTVFGTEGMDNSVEALQIDASGSVFAAGSFTMAGDLSVNHIAEWDGTAWSTLDGGVGGVVHALALDANGNLYAGGDFTTAGGVSASNVARWDGASWSPLGDGINGPVYALAVDTAGTLFAGGDFTASGIININHVAKWDGSEWSSLQTGVDGAVYALAIDGDDNVYAGGAFTVINSMDVNHIAKWDGQSWQTLSRGTNSNVRAIAVSPTGVVYAGGDFSTVGTQSYNRIARWDGTAWSGLGTSGIDTVNALAVAADGLLYVGGSFADLNSASIQNVATWDGTTWAGLGSGADGTVHALAVNNSSVYVGGDFTTAGGKSSSHIGRWALSALASTATVPPIQPVVSGTVAAGDSFSVYVNVGADTATVTNLFGIGFTLSYDPGLFRVLTIAPEAFIDDGDLIFSQTVDSTAGEIHASVTRKRGAVGVSGSGAVVRIDFAANSGISDQTSPLALSEILAVDPDGVSIPLSAQTGEIEVANVYVWPGDTDNDGDADISDVLPIGANFGLTGPARADASLTWEAQLAPAPWNPADAMYADATGDGVVNQNDVLPIGVNFSLARSAGASLMARLQASPEPLGSIRIPALSAGAQFPASLSLGSSTRPVAGALGFSAEFTLPPNVRVVHSRPGRLLDDGDLVTLEIADGNRYYVAYTRKRPAKPVAGSGPVLELSLQVTAPLDAPADIRLDALTLGTLEGSAPVLAESGTPIQFTSPAAVATESELPRAFALRGSYPNPFSTRATLTFDLPQSAEVTVVIYDLLGREVRRLAAGEVAAGAGRRLELNGSGLPSGTYLYRLQAEMPSATRSAFGRFVLIR
ncbi:MAG TPA: cohesin domain-containing protein [Rhodothermales bacterium]|nr:cohesin domain-containing protein [Rhodothermales bacterium]